MTCSCFIRSLTSVGVYTIAIAVVYPIVIRIDGCARRIGICSNITVNTRAGIIEIIVATIAGATISTRSYACASSYPSVTSPSTIVYPTYARGCISEGKKEYCKNSQEYFFHNYLF